jgi:hypothetical protein
MGYEEKILLLKESYSKYKKILKHEELYDLSSQFIFYLMGTLLVAIDEPYITAEINNSENITVFLDSMWPNRYAFEEI